MPFDDSLTQMQSPHRALALCQLVARRPLSKRKLRDLFQPEADRTPQFDETFRLCANGGLVKEDYDGTVRLLLTADDISSTGSFRRAVCARAMARPELVFTRFTAWYIACSEQVLAYTRDKPNRLWQRFHSDVPSASDGRLFNDTNVIAWRTWAAFLGYGTIHQTRLLPNAAVRILDLLLTGFELGFDHWTPFGDFMDWLSRVAPELDNGIISIANRGPSAVDSEHHHVSLAVSNGLRLLHDTGSIVLENTPDAADAWFLSRADGHEIIDRVSSVMVREARTLD